MSGSLADYGRHERQRAGVVEELLSWRGRHRKTEDVTTRVWRHVHALLVVVALVVGDRLHPLQAQRHGERVRQPEAVLVRGMQVRQLGEEAQDRFVDAAYQPAIDRDPEGERRDALRHRLYVMQCIG